MKKPEEVFKNRIKNEKPIVMAELLSDIHQTMPWKDKQLQLALNDIKDRNIPYLCLLGDLTNNAYGFQFQAFFSLLMPYGFHQLIALGNHDTFHPNLDEALHIHPLIKRHVLQQELYHKETIQQCSFYVLNTQKPQENNMYIEKDQFTWLEQELTKDRADWKFILCHHPLADTHPGSEDRSMHVGYQNAQLESILKGNPQIVYLSGHLHNSYSHTALCMKDDLLCINVPSFHQVQRGIRKEQIGLQLDLYHDFLHVRFRDYRQHQYLSSVSYIFDRKKRCIHTIYPK